jgi:hypothetical protein
MFGVRRVTRHCCFEGVATLLPAARRRCATQAPANAGIDTAVASTATTFRRDFRRVLDVRAALSDVIEASVADHGAPPIDTMRSAIPALTHAAASAAPSQAVFEDAVVPSSLASFVVSLAEDEASDLAQSPPAPSVASVKSASDTGLTEDAAAARGAGAGDDAGAAAASNAVFSCSMCERRFRLRQSADMHNQTRHNGQATITLGNLAGGGTSASAGGAAAAAGAGGSRRNGLRPPDVPMPKARTLEPSECVPFPAAAPDYRKPVSRVGARVPTLLTELEYSTSGNSRQSVTSSMEIGGSTTITMTQYFGTHEMTTPDEISLPVSATLAASAVFIGRVVSVKRDVVAPTSVGEATPVTAVVLRVEGHPDAALSGSDDDVFGVGRPEFQEPVDVTALLVTTGPLATKWFRGSELLVAEGSYMMVTGRPRVLQVFSTDLGRSVSTFAVVVKQAQQLMTASAQTVTADS